jgi:hypothetical protein
MKETCKLLGVKRFVTSKYRPQIDGLIERFHSRFKTNIAIYLNDRHNDWGEFLHSVVLDSTGFSPFYLMFGQEVNTLIDIVLPQFPLKQPESQERLAKLRKAREISRLNLEEMQKRMKEAYDKIEYM